MSDVRFPEVEVQLTGEDGNAFSIIGRVSKGLREAGHAAAVAAFVDEATSGSYDDLLMTVSEWVEVS